MKHPIQVTALNKTGGFRTACLALVAFVLGLTVPVKADGGWDRRDVDSGAPQDPTGVAIGDADNDGDKEIVASGDGFGVRMYDGRKSVWNREEIASGLRASSVIVADADNNGGQDVIVSTKDGAVLAYARGGTGWTVQTVERGIGRSILRLSCGDADNDGLNEIVAATEKDLICVYENSVGYWRRSTVDSTAGRSILALAIEDPDNDGKNEILAGTGDKSLFLYECYSGVYYRTTVDGNVAPGAASLDVGDCDNDGKREVYVGTSGKKIYRYDFRGGSWPRAVVDLNAGGDVSGLEVRDLDGDRFNELVAIACTKRAAGSRLLVYQWSPQTWLKLEADGSAPGEAVALAAGDGDDDGAAELVAGTSVARKVLVYDRFLVLAVSRDPATQDIVLTWESDPGTAYYVYYSDYPYRGFAYASSVIAADDTTLWKDDGTAIPVHPRNVVARYYKIRKYNPDVFSNTVGKFTRTFSTEMHLTSVPLVQYSKSIQDVIGDQLTGAPAEGYADRVWKWRPDRTAYEFAWLVDGIGPKYDGTWWCPRPFGPSRMTLDFGDGFFVQSKHGGQKVTFVGSLPEGVVRVRAIGPGLGMVGAPCAEPVLLDSSDLYISGAHGAPSELQADRVWLWDEEGLRYRYYWLLDLTNTESDGTWWDSEQGGPAGAPMVPGFGYWYQSRGEGFYWSFVR